MRNALQLIVLLFCLPSVGFARAETNGYSAIWRRNVFGLKTPPPPMVVTSAPVVPLQIKLTGIACLPPNKWAVLQIQERGLPATALLLKEGEREAGVELSRIDAHASRVIVRNAGALMTLTFEKTSADSRLIADNSHTPLPTTPVAEAGDP